MIGSLPLITVNGTTAAGSPKKQGLEKDKDSNREGTAGDSGEPGHDNKEFKELTCVEMMDFLTRDLVHWQGQFAA